MIRADHKRWARLVFNPWIDRLLRKSFTNFFLANRFPDTPSDLGLLITPNHMSWWDGFFIDHVCRKMTDRRFHIMMLEHQLRRYWFFRKLGAYSIDQNDPENIKESLGYTAELMRDPCNIAVMFPQGILEPYDLRPVRIRKTGLQQIAGNAHGSFTILPAAFKISFFEEQQPEIIARFGRVFTPEEITDDFPAYEEEFTRNIDLLDRASYRREYIGDLFS